MTPDDIIKLLDATCICGARKLHDPIQHAFAADLMSDVLRLNTEGLLLITGMANPQVIRTAEMADIPFILFVRDKQITAEMQQLAEENEILLLRCRQSMFRVCGELYKAGLHMEFNFNLEGGNFSRAGTASSEIKKILKQLNVDALLIKRIVVALYEAEVNVVAHAYEGVMNVVLDGKSIVVTITDKGPGIPDIAKAMQEGFSTASPEVREMGFGAGMGLPNMKKNCDRLNIESTVNVGTKVTMTTYLR